MDVCVCVVPLDRTKSPDAQPLSIAIDIQTMKNELDDGKMCHFFCSSLLSNINTFPTVARASSTSETMRPTIFCVTRTSNFYARYRISLM